MFATSDTSSAGWGLCLILAFVGLFIDLRYQERGGMRPTKKHKVYFLVALSLFVVLLVAVGIMGGDAGGGAVYLGALLFIVWELGRWRVRRKNPLSKIKQAQSS